MDSLWVGAYNQRSLVYEQVIWQWKNVFVLVQIGSSTAPSAAIKEVSFLIEETKDGEYG